jgi:hypothetical protein
LGAGHVIPYVTSGILSGNVHGRNEVIGFVGFFVVRLISARSMFRGEE